MNQKKKTAAYQAVTEGNETCYIFCCDLSGAHVCRSRPVLGAPSEEALEKAWEQEGRKQFNQCQKCGRWVIDAMYNADVLECVECAPYEDEPRFCKTCGAEVTGSGRMCTRCGRPLIYTGGGVREG